MYLFKIPFNHTRLCFIYSAYVTKKERKSESTNEFVFYFSVRHVRLRNGIEITGSVFFIFRTKIGAKKTHKEHTGIEQNRIEYNRIE